MEKKKTYYIVLFSMILILTISIILVPELLYLVIPYFLMILLPVMMCEAGDFIFRCFNNK